MSATDTYSACKTETLPRLEREADELERKLCEVRASVITLRAKRLVEKMAMKELPAPGDIGGTIFTDGQQADKKDSRLAVMLAELPLQHPLRRKWRLFSDLAEPSDKANDVWDIAQRDHFTQEGKLHLFGILENGESWECSIVYSTLMNSGGITIGRDASGADVVLADESVSRCHARLELTNRGLVVTDEGSTNGTGINDMMLTKYDRQAVVNDGDILNIADINLFVELI